jgi:hypothetical protein
MRQSRLSVAGLSVLFALRTGAVGGLFFLRGIVSQLERDARALHG